MSDVKLLAGSLSNDLLRVASLKQRGADKAAERFLTESKRWASQLASLTSKKYIAQISKEIAKASTDSLTLEMAERYLMYSVLLQNYALHCPEVS